MRPLELAEHASLRGVKFVLTDMDETLTYKGRLSAATYSALEALQAAGVIVIPVTGAPAGWCDQMARMWPVDGVIGENGGLFFRRRIGSHDIDRVFWHDEDSRRPASVRLEHIGRDVLREMPGATLADDQPFRLASLAFDKPEDPAQRDAILRTLQRAGADVTVNNLWILGWLGGYDKLAMTRRVLREQFATDIDKEASSLL
ncbi:HAD family hydrolase [Rhizobium sp. TRM95796]|uniref:HAD family hydrolase n=1 Tax=Rhizobium sp. TRM95796 TaxID=2979862 RepID=UPI0021E74A94|nr:HAD hydrolase family protein [Rhizobium sp. TRM95796]MCV3769082.1 HAD hydrolase family protein [Rhizobium sp. TRM95796]